MEAYIPTIYYLLGAVLPFLYLPILLGWLIYLVKRLIISNKILRGTKRHETQSSLSVYNAKTQVVKYKYLVAIISIEMLSILFIGSNNFLFEKLKFIWVLGLEELNSSIPQFYNIPTNLTNYCEIDPRVFAIFNHPYIMLLPIFSHILILLLLTMLSIQTFYLETRYRFSSHVRTSFKLFVVLSLQALVLTLTCSSRYTVLFEPLLFLLFFFIFFVVYLRYFHRLKLVIRGRMFEINTFEDYSQKFAHDQRAIRRFVIITYLFCFSLIYPSVFFSFEFYIRLFLIPLPRFCTFELFFRNDPLTKYVPIVEAQIHWYMEFIKFIPPLIIVPFILLILPHIAYVLYWAIDKIKKRPKSLIFSDPLIAPLLI